MGLLRKLLMGVVLAAGVVTVTAVNAPPAHAATTRFLVMYGYAGSGVYPYCGADTGDYNYAVAAANALQNGGWAVKIVNASTP